MSEHTDHRTSPARAGSANGGAAEYQSNDDHIQMPITSTDATVSHRSRPEILNRAKLLCIWNRPATETANSKSNRICEYDGVGNS